MIGLAHQTFQTLNQHWDHNDGILNQRISWRDLCHSIVSSALRYNLPAKQRMGAESISDYEYHRFQRLEV